MCRYPHLEPVSLAAYAAGPGTSISGLNVREAQISGSGQYGIVIDSENKAAISDLDLRGSQTSSSGFDGVHFYANDSGSIFRVDAAVCRFPAQDKADCN